MFWEKLVFTRAPHLNSLKMMKLRVEDVPRRDTPRTASQAEREESHKTHSLKQQDTKYRKKPHTAVPK